VPSTLSSLQNCTACPRLSGFLATARQTHPGYFCRPVPAGGLTMPVVSIKLAGNLTRDQKKKIAEEITETLERHALKPKRYTYISFEELADENWAIGGQLLDEED
jgi:4-oxalocrotonate tautomerase